MIPTSSDTSSTTQTSGETAQNQTYPDMTTTDYSSSSSGDWAQYYAAYGGYAPPPGYGSYPPPFGYPPPPYPGYPPYPGNF